MVSNSSICGTGPSNGAQANSDGDNKRVAVCIREILKRRLVLPGDTPLAATQRVFRTHNLISAFICGQSVSAWQSLPLMPRRQTAEVLEFTANPHWHGVVLRAPLQVGGAVFRAQSVTVASAVDGEGGRAGEGIFLSSPGLHINQPADVDVGPVVCPNGPASWSSGVSVCREATEDFFEAPVGAQAQAVAGAPVAGIGRAPDLRAGGKIHVSHV